SEPLHHHDRAGATTTRAHADQRIATGQIVQRVDDEAAVVRPRLREALAEEILHLYPHAIAQQVRVGHHDDVDAVAFLEAILAAFDAVRIRRLRRPLNARRQRVALAGGLQAT